MDTKALSEADQERSLQITNLAQGFLSAAYSGDMDAARSFLTNDIELSIAGTNAISGRRQGPDAFFENFGRMLEMSSNTYTMTEQTDWCASKDRVVLLAIEETQVNGQAFRFKRAIIYRFRDTLIDQISVYEHDPEIAAQAFE